MSFNIRPIYCRVLSYLVYKYSEAGGDRALWIQTSLLSEVILVNILKKYLETF